MARMMIIVQLNINSNAMMIPVIRMDPRIAYFVEEDREERMRSNSMIEYRAMNMMRDNPISMLRRGGRRERRRKEEEIMSRGMEERERITADLGY